MKILIVAATKTEIEPLVCRLEAVNSDIAGTEQYRFLDLSVHVLVTGIGMAFTIYKLTKCLCGNSFDLVINAGIAGSFSDKYENGAVVNVTEEQFADLGIEDHGLFMTLFDLNLELKNTFPFTGGILKNSTTFNCCIINELKKVSGVTSGTVHGNAISIEKIMRKFEPDVETMEGAAFFFVCLCEKVPFVEIRAISNKVEPRDPSKWNRKLAIENLCTWLVQFLQSLDTGAK